MSKHSFDCIGYRQYLDLAPEIREVVNKLMDDPNYRYFLAINEAALNACKYSVFGVQEAQVHIELRISNFEIRTHIVSQTKPFDAFYLRDEFRKIAEDSHYRDLEWGSYTGVSDYGRGFWYMLSGVDYLIVEETGQHITLVHSLPFYRDNDTCVIKRIVPRFCIETKRGVIVP